MSDDSLNNPSKSERQRRRRKRASRNLEDVGDGNVAAASTSASKGRSLALQDLPNQRPPGQVRNPSSGNSNSLEMNEERKTKSRRSRKRAPRQGAGIEVEFRYNHFHMLFSRFTSLVFSGHQGAVLSSDIFYQKY